MRSCVKALTAGGQPQEGIRFEHDAWVRYAKEAYLFYVGLTWWWRARTSHDAARRAPTWVDHMGMGAHEEQSVGESVVIPVQLYANALLQTRTRTFVIHILIVH